METIGTDSATLRDRARACRHIYSIEWRPNVVRFYFDSVLLEASSPADTPQGGVRERPSFIVLSVAVGGQWPGSTDGSTAFPVKMLMDYVQVYNAMPAND